MSNLALALGQNFSGLPLPNEAGGFINPEAIVESFELEPGMKVADFGSGSGYFTILMAQKVGPRGVVTALDILESTLEVVRSRAVVSGLTNLQTVRADLEVYGSSSLPDASQNLVLIANLLFQSNQKPEVLKEARRVLSANGKLIVMEWKKEAGSLGPPLGSRMDRMEVRDLGESLGLSFVREINAGSFHFGLMFKK